MGDVEWRDDSTQFPRLIAEAVMAGAFTLEARADMCRSMDVRPADLQELIDRAILRFETDKRRVLFGQDDQRGGRPGQSKTDRSH